MHGQEIDLGGSGSQYPRDSHDTSIVPPRDCSGPRMTLALTNAAGASLDDVTFSAAECAVGLKGSKDRLTCASSVCQLLLTEGTVGVQKKYGVNGRWTLTGHFSRRNTSQAATTTPLGLAMWTPVYPVIAFSGAKCVCVGGRPRVG